MNSWHALEVRVSEVLITAIIIQNNHFIDSVYLGISYNIFTFSNGVILLLTVNLFQYVFKLCVFSI